MICTSPIKILDPRFPSLRKEIYVPCKSCTACRINHTSEWTLRLMMELEMWKSARFITLTYKPGTTPENKTLVKEDVSDFFKALRQNLNGRSIKYFACGEYGETPESEDDWEKGKRPHYHAIVFGLTGSLEDRQACFYAWKKAEEFQWFGKNWMKTCGTVTPDSARYVSGYCQKKLNGDLGEKEYTDTGRIPPFQLQSKKLGESYFVQHLDQFSKDGFVYFNGARHPIPETWKRKFELEFPDFKDEFYEKEKQEYLLSHRDIDSAFYDWVYRQFGYTLSTDDLSSYTSRQAIADAINAKNNLKKRKTL